MSFNVVIPARLNSSRLKEKVLIEIHGIPMLIHVAQRVSLSGAKNIVIATDDKKIAEVASHYNFKSPYTAGAGGVKLSPSTEPSNLDAPPGA